MEQQLSNIIENILVQCETESFELSVRNGTLKWVIFGIVKLMTRLLMNLFTEDRKLIRNEDLNA